MIQKRMAAIHDLSCLGKCSLTVALPVVSCFGIECVPLPTALLSSHFAALPQVAVLDLTAQMDQSMELWASGGVACDGVFSGYLCGPHQAALTAEFVRRFRRGDTLFVADPAMADRGRLYRGFGPDHVQAMTRLCAKADVILPNITEACMMLGEPYPEDGYDQAFAEKLIRGLFKQGAKAVVLTGVAWTPETVGIACCDGGETACFARPRTPGHYSGTGDLFASVFAAARLRGLAFQRAAVLAMDFTAHVIEETAKNQNHRPYGVDFEPCLPWLMKQLTTDEACVPLGDEWFFAE